MKNENSNQNSQNDHQSNTQLGMIAVLGIGALIWKNEDKIRLWFYENVLSLTLVGLGILALVGMYLWHRFKKKEAEYFERRRALRQVQPVERDINYYKRKEPNERNFDR
jgi:hypothetical protein